MDNVVKQVKDKCETNGVKLLYLCKFGSHLYGTDTENSDTDYKGIFLPSKEQCFLQTCPKNMNVSTGNDDSRNTKEDVDISLWSLQYFLQLVSKGETNALDLLFSFTHKDCIVYTITKMSSIFNNYNKLFDIKNCNAFVGYALGQVKKYGIKGSRLGVLKRVYEHTDGLIESLSSEDKLPENITDIKLDSFLDGIEQAFYDSSFCFIKEINGIRSLVLCGKVHNGTISLQEFYERVKKEYEKYGDRAKKAERNEGIDWKCIHHAYRSLCQMNQLIHTGKISFPLDMADYLLEIKQGKYNFVDLEKVIYEGIQEIDFKLNNDLIIADNKKDSQFIRNLILSFYT